MNRKLIFSTVIFLVLAIISVVLITNDKEREKEGIILFYGVGCPHCLIVEEYIKKEGIDEKVVFSQKEVYNNKQNAAELVTKAKLCEMPTDSIGVPFLWDGAQCFVGDQKIIEFLKMKAGL